MKRLLLFLCLLIPFFPAWSQTKLGPEPVYTFVEQMPMFPGGETKMMEYLALNVRYPSAARLHGQEGIVFVSFVINKKGEVTQPEILKSASPVLDAEAIRVCETMPKWQPGKQNGQEVAVKYTLPVRFKIGNKKPAVISSADADLMPQFPGGEEALALFLADNLVYPAKAYSQQIKGKVVVSFNVDETGKLSDLKPEESSSPFFTEEALRVVSTMPAWKPAIKEGQPVTVRHAVSIPFSLKMPLQYAGVMNDTIIDGNKIENPPQFPGGLEGMMYYLGRNMKYPRDAVKKGIEGRVILSFVVDTQGEISNIKILKPLFPSMDAEAQRVVSNMPPWKPGMLHGKPVKVRFTLPVLFSIREDAPPARSR